MCAFVVLSCFIIAAPTLAEDAASQHKPWKNISLDFGWNFATLDTTLNLGVKGVGVALDAEDFFGLDTSTSVFRANAYWRFTDNQRHRFDIKWYSLSREGFKTIGRDITIEDDKGNEILLPLGTTVNSHLDLDLYRASYSYSFFQDDRIDLAGGIGVYILPIDIGLNASGIVSFDESEKFTAPLPTLGLRADFAITPKLFLRSYIDFLYLEIDQFKGSIFELTLGLEYLFWKHLGVGFAFDTFRLDIESDGEDYPGIDFNGNLKFDVTGLNIYMKLFF